MHRALREPLLHFVILGALLFAGYAIMNRDGAQMRGEIVVSAAQIEHLSVQFARTWQRAPTRQEIAGLIENHVREEVLYREGVARGLDRDDQIIRRRVQQKVEFFAASAASQEPGDAQLQAYFDKNRDKFVVAPRVSFVHVYVNPEGHTDANVHASRLLQRLRSSGTEGPLEELGDMSLLPREFDAVREAEVISTFGEIFARELAKLTTGSWQGPVHSAYGLHLVLVTQRTEAKIPPLGDVRDVVAREVTREQQQRAGERFYQELRKRYGVTIEDVGFRSEAELAASP